jgi:hypothetical protein
MLDLWDLSNGYTDYAYIFGIFELFWIIHVIDFYIHSYDKLILDHFGLIDLLHNF